MGGDAVGTAVRTVLEWQRGEFTVSTDPNKLQLEAIAAFLSTSYWAHQRSVATIRRSLEGSLCFGVYQSDAQIGLARVVTDYAAFAYLCDVYILESYRGLGLGKWLMQTVLEHPDLQGIRRFMLATRDAHQLYAQYGFAPLEHGERFMERFDSSA